MKKVAIIGVGLIGGSLGMALKAKKRFRVIGLGRNPRKLKLAKKLKAIDDFSTDWENGVKDADIVVICTPVNLTASVVKRILPFVKKSAVITDAGSVKGSVVKSVKKVFSLSPCPLSITPAFIGSHPMAGLEKTGVKFATASLYKGATVVLTPDVSTPKKTVKVIKQMWEDVGANIIFMKPDEHDKIVAITSHLPHIIAFALSAAVGKMNNENRKVSKILAGSFKDMTRIAGSSPSDWATICNANKNEIKNSIKIFVNLVKTTNRALNNTKKTNEIFNLGYLSRKKLLG